MAKGFASYPENINRRGRPKKGTSLTEILTKELRNGIVNVTDDAGNVVDRISKMEAVARRLADLAANGDLVAIKYVFDRVDGMPRIAIEQSQPFPGRIELVTTHGINTEDVRVNADTGLNHT